ncbi:MAG TPA: hypothetical protein VFW11_19990 [Cyclobacteriaceae bacterium]|nr:hypothetical protein [Cyclobacteriaceae bacterium]
MNTLFHNGKNKRELEQAVIIHFNYGMEDSDPFYELVSKLRDEIELRKVGDYDGHEMAMDNSDGFFYMYGPSAEVLFKSIKPILEATNFMKGATALLRFGPPGEGAQVIEVTIGS